MDNEERVRVFWEKCIENYAVAKDSFTRQQFNASASRYYYALYLGFGALFVKRDIKIKIKKGSWDKMALRDQAIVEFPEPSLKVGDTLDEAWTLRVRADYKDIPVRKEILIRLSPDVDKLFKVLNEKINGS